MIALRHERGAAMVRRVHAEACTLVGDADARMVRDVLEAAIAWREQTIDDDHDARYLHPARTIRVLVADAALAHATALAAAALIDSVDEALAPAALAAPPDVQAFANGVPRYDGDDMIERLVTADPAASIVALAERLDHARHLHLRDDIEWAAFHRSIRGHYIPAARRLSPALARRFERWADAFERRLLLRG